MGLLPWVYPFQKNKLNLVRIMPKGCPLNLNFWITGTLGEIRRGGINRHAGKAVGYKNFRLFMKVVSDCLKDDSLFLYTIGNNFSRKIGDPWLNKYIFPNGLCPLWRILTESY